MIPSLETHHPVLLQNESAKKIGRAHCAIVIAEKIWHDMRIYQPEDVDGVIQPVQTTEFGQTVGPFEKYWLNQNIDSISEFERRLDTTYPHLVQLKRRSEELLTTLDTSEYKEIINSLFTFCTENSERLDAFSELILWLESIDKLGPFIFFVQRRGAWSSSQAGHRAFRIKEDQITEGIIKRGTETVFGLYINYQYVFSDVMMSKYNKKMDGYDPEVQHLVSVSYEEVKNQVRNTILKEFATYFEKMRIMADLIKNWIEDYICKDLIYNELFIKKFILKSIEKNREETRLWDFKKEFGAWRNPKEDNLKLDLMKNITIYANRDGGLLIIGIDNRKNIIGLENIENKIIQTKRWMATFIGTMSDLVEFKVLPMNNSSGTEVQLLIIFIPQTKANMIVTHKGAEYIVKRGDINVETISSVDLMRQKASVAEDNFRFTRDLFDFVYNNKLI